jgi:small conductance mechanosensitive channel
LVYASVLVLVLILALTQLGVETTSLVAVLGAAGLAVGLALQVA